MSINLPYYVPLGYTYRTRLHKYDAVAGFVGREVAPLTLTLTLVYHIAPWLALLAFLGYLSFYECGYLWNDMAESATEPGGDRLCGLALNSAIFLVIRATVLGLVSTAVYYTRGAANALCFGALNVLLVVLLVLHTSRVIRRVRFLRLATFAALAFYRYLPAILPFLPWTVSRDLLVAVFLSYGLARVVVYALRKHGDLEAREHCESSNTLFQATCCTVFAPVFVTVTDLRNWHLSGSFVTWASYSIVALVWLVLRSLRWFAFRTVFIPQGMAGS